MLGIDVEISNERREGDSRLRDALQHCGEIIEPEGFTYEGSFCTHLYSPKSDLRREFVWAHHHHFKKRPSEKFVSNAVGDLAVHLMQVLFGRKKPATRDPRDKRMKT